MDRLYKGVAGFLLTVCLVAATGHGALGQPDCTFEHYSVNDGLSQHTVSAIFQDSRDLMWFGTFNGLNSFDGHRFRHYRPVSERNPQVTNPRIDEIGEDMYGKIWVRTYDGKAYQVDRATGVFVPVLPGELHRNHTVEGLYFSPSGRVWLLTCPGIIEAVPTADIHSTAINHLHTGNSALPSDNVLSVVTDLRGRDVVVTDGGLLVCGGPDGETVFTAELPELNCCLPVEGGFLCGTGSGTILTLDERLATTAGYRVSDYPVTRVYPSSDGRYLVLTGGGGFLLWDPEGGPGLPYRRASHPALPSDKPVSAYVDSRGEAWIDMPAEGVVQFSIPTGRVRFHRPEVEKVGVYSISAWSFAWEDVNGLMWVYPRGGGLSYYDRDTDRLEYFHNRPSDPARRLSNILLQCFSDRQGNLWMSTYSRGIDKVSFTGPSLPNIMPDRGSTAIAGNEVRAVYRQPSGTMWIATREGSLYTGPGGEGPFTRMGEAGMPGAAPWFDAFVYCITEDSGGNIWLGTRNKGVYRLTPDGHGGYAVTHIEHDPADPYGINSNSIYTIYEDSAGTMWFGTWGGGVNYLDTHSEGFRFINTGNHMRDYPAAGFDKVRHITGDGRGNLWVATTDGALCIRNPQAGGGTVRQIETYSLVPGGKDSPAVNDIHDILLRGDTVWLATFGGGLNRMVPAPQGGYTVTHINSEDGFPADIILTLEADSAGNLWMCSETDIIKYDPATGGHELFSPLRYPDLAEASFSEGASLAGADGRIYFGHSHGIYVIDPGELPRDGFVPDIRFGRLLLYNNEVTPVDEHSPLAAGLDDTPVLTLNHRQRVFTIEFSALDFRNPRNIEYSYRLEGFDREWNNVCNQHAATYTNLPYGRYVFHVRSTNAGKVPTDNARTMEIVLTPPFWRTGWAYLLYGMLAVGMVLLVNRVIFSFYKLRNKVEVEKKMTDMKLKFFTDISHEIRTPLTLISSPVDHLLSTGQLPAPAARILTTVKQNTDRLLRLVNQLLDFRKIQNSRMKLYIEPIGLGEFSRHVCASFESEAAGRDLTFTFSDLSDGKAVWLDKDKTEKILYNLLSNAFKFTPDGGKISCTVCDDVNNIDLIVEDDGEGIPASKLSVIFNRFESSDSSASRGGDARPTPVSSQKGTGIGLSLVKELVELHNGSVFVESLPGKGTRVTVSFSKDAESVKALPQCFIAEAYNPGDPHEPAGAKAQADKTVLFIEDNDQLREFLTGVASGSYGVLGAADGETGIAVATERQPDIIVTDLMMEGTDGFEVVRRLREEIGTSHIPIIILTAKTELDDKLRALRLGADDFLTKPFSPAYLMARIGNLLDRRKELHGRFAASTSFAETLKGGIEVKKGISPSDTAFMDKLIGYMETNLENPDLRIEDLADLTHTSRSLLFKKIKSLTGFSPVEFIREFRIQRATELILQGEHSFKEITYMVGMNDSRYFARCFKQKHGITPSEFKAKHTS